MVLNRVVASTILIPLSMLFYAAPADAKTNTTTTLASSVNPSGYGTSVTFTATLSPTAATGTVTFKDGTTTLGTGTLSGGKTTLSIATLTVGSHSITAAYGGDTNYNSSTSSTLTQTVNKATTTTALASSANPSGFGTSVTFTATLSPTTATGTVTFKDGTTTLGTGTLSGGKATYGSATLAVGAHSITAVYGGDTNDNTSTSSTLTQTVNKATTTTTLASSANPSGFGTSVTFTATLSPATATGTVTFKDGSTTLGTGTLSSGKATYSNSALAVGSHSITAAYGGDTNDNASTSSTLTQTVNKAATTTALASSANPSTYGTSVTFTATLSTATASGTVTFKDGTTTLGTGTLSSGKATFSTSTLSGGTHAITGAYGGDANDNTSTSSTLNQTVNVTLVSIAVTPTNAVIAAGNTQQFTATGTYSDSSTQNLTGSSSWSSSAVGVATIGSAGLATAVASGQSTIQATVGAIHGTAPLGVVGFALTGSLNTGRNGHTATLLSNGNVLITGGYDINSSALASAELYNSATGTFTATGSLNTARTNHTATLLDDGTVLIVGGFDSSFDLLASTEIYNPATGTFTLAGSLGTARANHTSTLLANGKVLVVGGIDSNSNALGAAELYDPSIASFVATGSLNNARGDHAATLLNDGTVLISGGATGATLVAIAELYNPVAGTFSAVGSLNTARLQCSITLLNSGMVLIAGGQDFNGNVLASAELYNPATQTFTLTGNLNRGRGDHSATLLSGGLVLVEGGYTATADMTASAELYDPTAATFTATGGLNVARQVQTASLLTNGLVLVAGGFSDSQAALNSVELYQPAMLIPPNLVSIAVSALNPSIPVGTAQKFTATGTFSNNSTQTLASVTWSSSTNTVATISNDSSNRGVALGLATGTTTVSACTGTICGSTTLTVVVSEPEITSLSPISGPAGSSVTLAGSGFGTIQGASTIILNQTEAMVTSWAPTSIVAIVPNETTGNFQVTVGGVPSNLIEFTVLPTPAISTISPISGDIGTPVQISGDNFGDTQVSGSTVMLNGLPLTITLWSATYITATVPSGASTGNIVVTVAGVQSNPVSFSVTNVPSIFSISPILGPVGTMVTITGGDFGTSPGTVTFSGVPATTSGWGPGGMVAVVPAGATTGPVVVTAGTTSSNGVVFTVPGPPNISGLNPTFGAVGITVTVTGTNFGNNSSHASTVSFNGHVAAWSTWTPTQIVVTVPAGATSGNVTVTDSGVTGAAAYFGVTSPVISSLSATSAEIGRQVIIRGSNFGSPQGTNTVTFNGTPAVITYWGTGEIDMQVPAGATTGNLIVSVNGASTNAGTFTIIPTPVITLISKPQATVSTSITITGTNFGNSIGQLFFVCTYITSGVTWTNTSITLPVPSCSGSGTVSVQANSPVGYYTYSSNSVNFAIVPYIANLTPPAGTLASSIQINGTGLGYGPGSGSVTFNGTTASPTAWGPMQISTAPPVGSGTGNVIVTVGGIASAGVNFTLQPGPAITSLSAPNGAPGNSVTITGSGFGSATGTVTFDGTGATVGLWSAGSITTTVPAGAATGNVVVTAGGVASNGVQFTVDPVPSISSLSQNSGSVGTPVYIYGSNFLTSQGTSTVKFNGTTATVTAWYPNSIAVIVPSGATTGNIVVNVLGQASAGYSFTVTAAPSIGSLSPSSGPVGMIVTVSGSNFGSSEGTSTLTFNNNISAAPVSWISGTIKAPVPAGTTTGPVFVTVNNGPSAGATFTVTSGPGITSISPATGGIGATVTIVGAGFGNSPTVKFNGTASVPTSVGNGVITVPVPAGATTGNIVVTAGGIASNGLSFAVSSGFSVTAVTPNSGNTGEPVSITGTGFGTQGTNTVTFNGAKATVISWSSTLIKTTVPAAATSGPVVVTIGGAPSDGINFTAQPQITGISPNPAALGANVTITGENFGATQGTSAVSPCGGVSTWTSSQIVLSSCAYPLGEMPIQVTVNGVSSTIATVSVIPDATISAVHPDPAAIGTPVLILGKGFGSAQGQSSVTINGATAIPTSWSDSAIVAPVPSAAAATGYLDVIVGGVAASPAYISFSVGPQSAPNSLQITPARVNMLIGDAKQFVVMDDQHQIRYDATWTVDNQTLASISKGYSPTLTAVAAGTVNLTATAGTASAQMPVTISALTTFPTGTVLWSAPTTPGFSPSQIAQALPTPYGPGVFALENSSDGLWTMVQAFTADGQQMWQNEVSATTGNVVPEANGGLMVTEACNSKNDFPMALAYLDPITGGQLWQLSFPTYFNGSLVCLGDVPKAAVRQDGALIVTMPLQISPALLILDGPSGSVIATPAIPQSTITDEFGNVTSCDCLTPVGQPIVDSDGSAYVEYEQRESASYMAGNPTNSGTLWLLKIATDNSTTATQISSSNIANLFPGAVIPDGLGGILATWTQILTDPSSGPPIPNPYQAADILNGVVTIYNLPMAPSVAPYGSNGLPMVPSLVLGENGVAFASYGANVVSFSLGSGSLNWNYGVSNGVAFMGYANGGGLTLVDGQSNHIPLDSGGNAGTTLVLSGFGSLQPTFENMWQGTLLGSGIPVASVQVPEMDWGSSNWAAQAGGPSPSEQATPMPYRALLPSCPGAQTPCAQEAIENAFGSLQTLIAGNCPTCQTSVFSKSQLGLTQGAFSQYLMRPHHFYDASRSKAPTGDVLCTRYPWWNLTAPPCAISAGNQSLPLYQYWQYEKPAAMTKTPSAQGEGLVTFWDPQQISAALGTSSGAIQNQATIFHEGLHGDTGIFDGNISPGPVTLESIFGFCYQPSVVITTYIAFNVFGLGVNPPKCPAK